MADAAGILKQVEYYFGDANLARDKFLTSEIAKDKDQWVPITVLLTFNRLKALTTDPAVVAEALAGSELVEVNEDKSSLRRNPAKPMLDEAAISRRSVYAKGFPVEGTTIDTVTGVFQAKDITVLSVRLRRQFHTRDFKGSVFVELESEDAASKALEAGLEVDGKPLQVEMKEAYLARKKAERIARKQEQKEKKATKRAAADEAEAEAAAEEVEIVKGCVVHVKGLVAGTQREDLKDAFGKYGSVAWVDFNRDDVEGYVRFNDENQGKEAAEKGTADALEIKGAKPELRCVSALLASPLPSA